MNRTILVIIAGAALSSATALSQDTQPATQPSTRPAETQPSTQPADSQPTTREAGRRGRGGRGPRGGAQTPDSGPATTTASTSASTSTASSSQASDEEKDRWLAVVNARVHTVTGPVLFNAAVLSKNGKIVAIGKDVQLPQECEVIDARGWYLYPGLVAVNSSGLLGQTPAADTTNVFGLSVNLASAVGITCALSGNEVGKVTWGSVEGITVNRNVFYSFPWNRRSPLDKSKVRDDLERVRGYLRDVAAHEIEKQTNKDAKAPDKEWLKGRYEDFRKLLTRETTAIATANSASELRELAELAGGFGFKLVIRDAIEGWIVADELGRAGVDVILTPRDNAEPDLDANRPTGSTIENAAILHNAGVRVAIVPSQTGLSMGGLAGRDLLHLNMEAAFAVRGGLSNDDALRAITIDAARILGVGSRVGSIEVGKDADLIVCDGDILHYMTQVHYTIVNGRLTYEKSKDTLLGHIRPEGKIENATFDDVWPRPLEWRD